MTKISVYNIDEYVTADDKWIGTDVNTYNKTKNFTPRKLSHYFNNNQVINTGVDLLYKYFTITPPEIRPTGTLSFETEIGQTVNFSAISTFLLSKTTLKGNDVVEFLNFLVGTNVLLYKAKNINLFGSYNIVSVEEYIPEPNFLVVNVDFKDGNGFIEEDEDYMISLIDISSGSGGSQDLQSVTDEGSTTTNGITITVGDGGGDGISSFSSQGYGIKGESNETYGVYGTSPSSTGVYGTSDNGYGVQGYSESGVAVYGDSLEQIGVKANSYSGTAMYVTSDIGTGLFVSSEDIGASIYSNGIGLQINGNGTIAIDVILGNSNKGLVINSGTSSTGNFIELDKNGVNKLVVNQQGELTATKLIKQGGASSEILAANGSVITAGTNITISGGTISSTGGGGGATNLSSSQTATNFTINSDTGTDATIPLGNGTLAGATLNDYTTAEKNKLAAITGTNTGDQNLQSVTNLGNTIVLPSNKNKGIDITIADLQNQYSNGITVTLEPQTGTYSNNDAFVAIIKGQNPNTLPFRVFGFSTITTGADNQSFVSEHNAGTISSEHYVASNAPGITSDFAFFNTNYVNVFKIDYLGNTTAAKFIKQGGFDYQFLKADGSVDNNTYLTSADLPSTLDLYATTSPDPVIAGYTALVRNIADTRYNTTAVDVPTPTITGTLASPTFCGAVISDPSVLLGNPGVFNFSVIGKIRRAGGSTSSGADFFYSIYKRDLAGVETLIANSAPVVVPANGGIYVEYISIALWNNGIFLSTDRVVLKFYGVKTGGGSGATYEFQFGGTDPVRGTAAISSAIIPNIYLKDLADVEKTPALNNEILYWNDSASLWEHSLAENLVPLATATQKGLVSTTTQTFAGDKTFTGATSIVTNSLDLGIQVNSNDVGIEVNASGVGIEVYGILAPAGVFNLASTNTSNIVEFKKDYVVKASVSNDGTFAGTGLNASGQTINTIASFDGSKNVVSLPTATYPSLTELAYVKGVTSGIQTQLNYDASATQRGAVTTGTQTFAGDKTFTGSINIENSLFVSEDADIAISAVSQDSDAISGESTNAIGIFGGSVNGAGGAFMTINGSEIVEFKANFITKAWVDSSGTFAGTGLNASGQTINTIASFDGSKNVVSLPTATYPSLTELAYVKGVTSGVQSQFSGKQDTLQSTVNIKSINGSSILGSGDLTISVSPQSAFTILANKTASSAVPTEQVYKDVAEQTYSLTPNWSGTAPTNILANTYKWNQVGSLVTVRVNLIYSTAGNITQAIIPLPTDMPTPLSPTGFTASLDILYYGTGMFNTSTSAVATTSRVCFLRRNSTNTGFEFVITHNASIAARVVSLTLQYFV